MPPSTPPTPFTAESMIEWRGSGYRITDTHLAWVLRSMKSTLFPMHEEKMSKIEESFREEGYYTLSYYRSMQTMLRLYKERFTAAVDTDQSLAAVKEVLAFLPTEMEGYEKEIERIRASRVGANSDFEVAVLPCV